MGVIRQDDLPWGTGTTDEGRVSFHRYDAVRDDEVNRNSGAQIEDALLNAIPVEGILRTSVSRADYNPAQVNSVRSFS